jgi:hypothetical protein
MDVGNYQHVIDNNRNLLSSASQALIRRPVMKNTIATNTKQRTRSAEKSQSSVDAVTKGSIAVMGGVSALVGLWAVACFAGAIFESGGLIELVKGFFKAIWGM